MKFKLYLFFLISFYLIHKPIFSQKTNYPLSIDTVKCPQKNYKNFQIDFNIDKYKLKCQNEYYEGAIIYFTNLISKKQVLDSAYLFRAISRIKLNHLLENTNVINDLNIELKLHPKNYLAYYYRAIAKKQLSQKNILISQGSQRIVNLDEYEYPEVLEDLNEALRINPNFIPALEEKKHLEKK